MNLKILKIMNKLELKYKCHVVQDMIVSHRQSDFGDDVYSLDCYNYDYPVEKLVYITYYLFRLLVKNKQLWCPYPHELSCLNFVLKHLRFMLTNVDSDGLLDYARSNFFYVNTR